MRTKFSALSGVGLAAVVLTGVAIPTQAQAKHVTHKRAAAHKSAGAVTLTKEQWDEIQAKLQDVDQLHQEVAQLQAAQQNTQAQASQAQAAATQAQTVATQAQSTATLAQTDASKAQTVADSANKEVKPLVGLVNNTKISGRMYYNLSDVTRKVNGAKTESDGGFQIKRFYVGIDHKFNDVLSGNITTDVKEIGGVGQALYIKKAYLQAKFSPALAVRLGSTDLPWIPYVEGIYGYRYVENTLTDRLGFGTSADWGVHVLGDLAGGHVSYDVAAIDGGGYRNPTFTKTVDFEGRVSAKFGGLNLALGGYTGKLGKDQQGVSTPHTATRLDALAAYKTALFTVGGEYFWAKNWTQVTSATEDKADGWSVFGNVNIIPKFAVFGRYDWTKPHKDTLPNLKDQYFNAGVQYEAFKNVDFALVYKHDKAENGTVSTSNGTIGGSTSGSYDEFGLWGVFQF